MLVVHILLVPFNFSRPDFPILFAVGNLANHRFQSSTDEMLKLSVNSEVVIFFMSMTMALDTGHGSGDAPP